MKFLALFLTLTAIQARAQTVSYKNIVRQTQQGSGVVWDMQNVAPKGAAQSALLHEIGGSLFQLWTINQSTAKDYLVDQKLVGAYLPKADIKIITSDPYTTRIRTRVDQPFTVEIQVSDLLSGAGLPLAATKVLFEQHIQAYAKGEYSLDPTIVASNKPRESAYISENGKTMKSYKTSSLTATDPTKAIGEEHFIIHALADGAVTQTQIASANVQIWPIASGEILGIKKDDVIGFKSPIIHLNLMDLYPRSDTYLMLYEGTDINASEGTILEEKPWDSDKTLSINLKVSDYDTKLTKNGTYTIALISKTPFTTAELLCDPITFSVERTITVNAMQTNFTDDTAKP
jgi:hypothetical protein